MSPPPKASNHWLRTPILLLLILALGAGLRFADLRHIPPGDWYDEAINGLDALRILEQPGWPLFFTTEGHPREPLYMYCTAAVFQVLGATATTLRATSALLGVLTLLVVFFWVREIAGERHALLTALALALLRWHIHFSRLGFRTILAPLFIALVLWLIWRMVKTRRAPWVAAAGIALGLGFTTYLSFRVVPILLGAVGVHAWLQRRRVGKCGLAPPAVVHSPKDRSDPIDPTDSTDHEDPTGQTHQTGAPRPALPPPSGSPARAAALRALMIVFLASLILGLIPTALDAIRHPDHLFKRAGEVSPFSEGIGPGTLLVLRQACDVGLMPFLRGDHVAKHNIPGGPQWAQLYGWRSPGLEEALEWEEVNRAARALGQPPPDPHGHGLPIFDPLAALFFSIGLVVLLRRVRRDTAACSVLAWMGLLALTSVLSYGAPNYLRTLGMAPAVAFTLVEGVEWARERVRVKWGRGLAVALVAGFFLHFGFIEAKRYFHDWPAHPMTWREFNTEFADLARAVRELPPEFAIQVPDYIRTHPTFAFETHGRPGVIGFEPGAVAALGPEFAEIFVVAPLPPYPPAPVPEEWRTTAAQIEVVRRPDDVPWAVLLRGPAPVDDPSP